MKPALEKSWWWRHLPKGGDEKAAWLELDEIPAFRYELGRRLFPLGDYPPYIKLPPLELDIVRITLAKEHLPVVVFHDSTRTPYDGYASLRPAWWNLNASNHSLQRQFLEIIEAERRDRRMNPPKKNKGNRNRGVSWKWLELMDTKTRLDERERSHLSQARKKAEEIRPRFLETWKKIDQHRWTMKQLVKENPALDAYSMERVRWPWLK